MSTFYITAPSQLCGFISFLILFLQISACSGTKESSSDSAASIPKKNISQKNDTTSDQNQTSQPSDVTQVIKNTKQTSTAETAPASKKDTVKKLDGDPDQLIWDKDLPDPYLTFPSNKVGKNYLTVSDQKKGESSSLFSCPGNSFLVGQAASYDLSAEDRIYQLYCQDFTDGQGRPLHKKNCSIAEPANEIKNDMNFSCPDGKFLAGHQSQFDTASKDRIHRFECCDMERSDGKKIAFYQQENPQTNKKEPICAARQSNRMFRANDEINKNHSELSFHCDGTTDFKMLRRIKSYYEVGGVNTSANSVIRTSTVADRVYSYECCAISPEIVEQ